MQKFHPETWFSDPTNRKSFDCRSRDFDDKSRSPQCQEPSATSQDPRMTLCVITLPVGSCPTPFLRVLFLHNRPNHKTKKGVGHETLGTDTQDRIIRYLNLTYVIIL